MDRKEFARAYAERSGVTVKWLKRHGREARPCDCGTTNPLPECEGWQMDHVDKTRPEGGVMWDLIWWLDHYLLWHRIEWVCDWIYERVGGTHGVR